MHTQKTRRTRLVMAAAATLLGAVLMGAPSSATAGCGCDHPPPDWAPVMPIFAPAGAEIRIYSENGGFEVGTAYEVKIGGVAVPGGGIVARNESYIDARVPEGARIGPASVEVFRRTWYWIFYSIEFLADYDDATFTVLPQFVRVPPDDGRYLSGDFEVAIDASGTVLLPVDLSAVLDGTQFAFQFRDLLLDFGPEDVVIYNKDGVDLTLFTLAVDDSAKRFWGSYHGWEVEEDRNLWGLRFNNRTGLSSSASSRSDILTYWRHEFRTYAFAHLPGMTHEVDGEGFHRDGTLHIDHDYIVLAFSGEERNAWFPWTEYMNLPLLPGRRTVRLEVAVMRSTRPVEPEVMLAFAEAEGHIALEPYVEDMSAEEVEIFDLTAWLRSLDEDELRAALEKLDLDSSDYPELDDEFDDDDDD